MATKTKKKAPAKAKKTSAAGNTAAPAGRLIPPKDGAAIRFYRIGHGDCFLLAFDGKTRPIYVLIDCGYKPGSPKHIGTSPKEICASLHEATGGHLDVAVITHEHQDHVNGITKTNFKDFTIGELWLAWTEDPDDDLANSLRKKFKDKLLGLLGARQKMAAAGKAVEQLDELLAFEFGGSEEKQFNAVAAAAMLGAADGGSMNKESMRLFKDTAAKIRFLRPHSKILNLPGSDSVRVFSLGPPRDTDLLETLDPTGSEEFHMAGTSASAYFAAAATSGNAGSTIGSAEAPFAARYQVPWAQAERAAKDDFGYGNAALDWRRVDSDWLESGDQLALAMNSQTNNSSLVLAFELGQGGKVLLFAADAQRGNWLSWAKGDWKDGAERVTARDLLSRTVLYKVGHHGSHNATLNGREIDDYPNLHWMADGDFAHEFTAMITAVRSWAETQKGWDHPLKAIKDALLEKASGRVFQTDTDFDKMAPQGRGARKDWDDFEKRTPGRERLYFEYVVKP